MERVKRRITITIEQEHEEGKEGAAAVWQLITANKDAMLRGDPGSCRLELNDGRDDAWSASLDWNCERHFPEPTETKEEFEARVFDAYGLRVGDLVIVDRSEYPSSENLLDQPPEDVGTIQDFDETGSGRMCAGVKFGGTDRPRMGSFASVPCDYLIAAVVDVPTDYGKPVRVTTQVGADRGGPVTKYVEPLVPTGQEVDALDALDAMARSDSDRRFLDSDGHEIRIGDLVEMVPGQRWAEHTAGRVGSVMAFKNRMNSPVPVARVRYDRHGSEEFYVDVDKLKFSSRPPALDKPAGNSCSLAPSTELHLHAWVVYHEPLDPIERDSPPSYPGKITLTDFARELKYEVTWTHGGETVYRGMFIPGCLSKAEPYEDQ